MRGTVLCAGIAALAVLNSSCVFHAKEEQDKPGLYCTIRATRDTWRIGETVELDIAVANSSSQPVNITVSGLPWEFLAKLERIAMESASEEAAIRKSIAQVAAKIASLEKGRSDDLRREEHDRLVDELAHARKTMESLKARCDRLSEDRKLFGESRQRGPRPAGLLRVRNVTTDQAIWTNVGNTWCGTCTSKSAMPPGAVCHERCAIQAGGLLTPGPGTYELELTLLTDAPGTHAPGRLSNRIRISILPAQ